MEGKYFYDWSGPFISFYPWYECEHSHKFDEIGPYCLSQFQGKPQKELAIEKLLIYPQDSSLSSLSPVFSLPFLSLC